jgi:putative sigma-54 modulation protein
MNFELKGVHFEVDAKTREYIDDKMPRLDFAKDLMVDFLLTLTREKRRFSLDATINFRWGTSRHVGVKAFDMFKGVDDLFDKLEAMIEKEKSRVQEHRRKEAERGGED